MAFNFKIDQTRGMEYRADGSQYVGMYRYGRPHGLGVLHWQDGERYEGEFLDGLREGMGVYTRADGAVYAGLWIGDAKEGKGKETYPYNRMYIGNWCKNMWHGLGCSVELTNQDTPTQTITGHWLCNRLTNSITPSPQNEAQFQEIEIQVAQAKGRAEASRNLANDIMDNLPLSLDPPVIRYDITAGNPILMMLHVNVTSEGAVSIAGTGLELLQQNFPHSYNYRHNLHHKSWELSLNGCDAELAERYAVIPFIEHIKEQVNPVQVTRVSG